MNRNPSVFALLASAAAIFLAGAACADDAGAPAGTSQQAAPPFLITPSRSTPVSTSQTSAIPVNAPEAGLSDAGFFGWSKPIWLSDLSLGIKESYDDNVLRVSGQGLPAEASWVNVLSLKLGINLAPFLGELGGLQTFSLAYQPDRATYSEAPNENFTAHRVNAVVSGKSGDISFGIDNVFLYNDGSRLAPTYALNQLSGAAANQNDKYRDSLAHAPARERRNQYQDRYAASLQFDTKYLFIRGVSALNFIDMNTYLFNTSMAPYKGYQDYVDRYDVNAGADLGFKVATNWALTIGYRDGYQYQQQYAVAVNSDQHYSSNRYQRLLFGFEGKLDWLTLSFFAGPDFRVFNPNTPISDLHTTRYYGEASGTVKLSKTQSLALRYKDNVFVSSTGLVPYEEYNYSLVYHWDAARNLGFDLGAKLFEHNYTLGNDLAGSAPSLREDLDYEGLAGITHTVAPHLVASVNYSFDEGRNNLSSLAATYAPSYRNFKEGVYSAGLQYKF